ncbi:MAG: hypothetical protein ACLP2P_10660 [Desulfobaccales bacterium]
MKTLLKSLLWLTLGAVLCLPGLALASTTYTFEDITLNQDANSWGVVPGNYQGYTWTHFEAVSQNVGTYDYQSYGNTNAFPSGVQAVYNGGVGGYKTVTLDFGGLTDVQSAYFSGWAVNNALPGYSASQVTLYGYNGANLVGSQTVTLTALFVQTAIDLGGYVTSIDFTIPEPDLSNHYWLMDNLTVLAVPVPPSAILLGSGLLGLVGLRRSRRI